MIRKLIGLPVHLLRKILGREKKPEAKPVAAPPRPRPPSPADTEPRGGHDHGHSHGGGHDHGHSHGGEREEEEEDHGHDHGHSHGGARAEAPKPVARPEPEANRGHDHSHGHGHDHDHGGERASGRVKQVWVEETPNPNARKFVCGVQVVEKGSAIFNSAAEAANNPAAAAIFGLGGVRSVFMVKDFVSVTREPSADWDRLAPLVVEALKRSL